MTFMDLIAANIAANAVSLGFVYFIWAADREKALGREPSNLPWPVIISGIVPSALVIASVIY